MSHVSENSNNMWRHDLASEHNKFRISLGLPVPQFVNAAPAEDNGSAVEPGIQDERGAAGMLEEAAVVVAGPSGNCLL